MEAAVGLAVLLTLICLQAAYEEVSQLPVVQANGIDCEPVSDVSPAVACEES